MGAMPPPPHWLPDDDVLLKNAVEAGASLESLAKGAVQFSRRFSIQELQDRWYSLLYDPVISEEALARMAEIELSSLTNQSRPHRPEGVKDTSSWKRKAESVRKSYYAMRKRICSEPFDVMDISLLPGPTNNNLGIQGPEFHITDPFAPGQNHGQHLNFGAENPLCNLFESEGLGNEGEACREFTGPSFSGFVSSSPQMPIWIPQDQENRDPFMILPQDGDQNEVGGLKTSMSCNSLSNLAPSTEDYFAELSTTLFDFDDELLFTNPDGKEILDKSYLDGLSSLLLDSPKQNEMLLSPIVGLGEPVVAQDVQFVGTSSTHHLHPGETSGCSSIVKFVPEAQVKLPEAANTRCLGPEYRNGVICCTLNTEDPEIPSNDDVFLTFQFPSPSNNNNSNGAHWKNSRDPSFLKPCLAKDNNTTRKANGGQPVMKNNQKHSSVPSRAIGSSQPSDHGVKFELPKSNVQRNPSGPVLANPGLNNFVDGGVKGKNVEYNNHARVPEVSRSMQKSDAKVEIPLNGALNAEVATQKAVVAPKAIENNKPLVPDEEEIWSENDFDVPYFSDVEAMILDMDLSPDEFDLYTNPDVQRYQHEETKRTIIRLEQAADSCMQRAIAAHGALAVLYGRCTKHFIKKPEVLLGRATEDFQVDIDLGREKNGSKISRRQAIIKMDNQGMFHLKNLGKCSVYVNDKEVATGQSLNLTSGCLIEVRGLSFIFETNHGGVQHHLGSTFLDHKPLTR